MTGLMREEEGVGNADGFPYVGAADDSPIDGN